MESCKNDIKKKFAGLLFELSDIVQPVISMLYWFVFEFHHQKASENLAPALRYRLSLADGETCRGFISGDEMEPELTFWSSTLVLVKRMILDQYTFRSSR